MDFLILVCCFGAVHGTIPWSGVLLAFGVSQIVASLPIIPGVLGIVEGSFGRHSRRLRSQEGPALAVVLVYRLLTFWLVIVVVGSALASSNGAYAMASTLNPWKAFSPD